MPSIPRTAGWEVTGQDATDKAGNLDFLPTTSRGTSRGGREP